MWVGKGLNINVLSDSWLPGEGAYIFPTRRRDSNLEMRVSELINYEQGCWDVAAVEATFEGEDMALVWDIPLSSPWSCDSLYWWPCINGVYFVKTLTYWLGRFRIVRAWEL